MTLRQPLPCSYTLPSPSCSRELKSPFGPVRVGRARPKFEILSAGFCDRSHMLYYESGPGPLMSGKHDMKVTDKPLKKMKKKKQLKLLKGLTRDLSMFTQIGFGLESDGPALLDQVKGDMISEAAEQLLERLQKIRAEEKELKRKAKEEKARLKAARIQTSEMLSSSSSSSESSDSECGEVIDMKRANGTRVGLQQVLEEAATSSQEHEKIDLGANVNSWSNEDRKTNTLGETGPSSLVVPTCTKKIEVCMGGKCKKSGGGALMEELQRAVGIEGVVSGCKCMGKCRDGPNVKVVDGGAGEDTVRAQVKSLCIGVGLEDVDTIVANLFGERQCEIQNQNQLGFAVAS